MNASSSERSDFTSLSLVERARARDPDAWRRLSRLYGPLVYGWARQAGLQASDAADLGQEVFRTVAARITAFRRDRPGDSFRGWLWGITRNKLKEFARRRAAGPQAAGGTDAHTKLHALADLPSGESGEFRETDSRTSLMHRALEAVRVEFEERTWQAFWRSSVYEHNTADIAEDLQMTQKAVRQAKYRVLRRLRLEMDELA